MGLSNRAFARLLELSSDNSVRAARKSGRLKRCILPDGSIDPEVGQEEWRANMDPTWQRKANPATDAAAPPTPPPRPTLAAVTDLEVHRLERQRPRTADED